MHPITSTEELNEICERLKTADFVTVDTEFLRVSTYYAKLCLVQLADDDGAFAVDPLAQNIDLSALWDLMRDQSVLKIFHACRQDFEIFFKEMGEIPTPFFDTQLAAMVCGYGDSVGYETLVNKIAKSSLDKSARYTDWSRRPLADTQIEYALGDVTHLRTIYRKLASELAENNRTEWLSEELAILHNPKTYVVEPSEAWQRIKVRTNRPRFLGILQELAAWRERDAIRRDMPRGRVAKDETLLEIAAHPPKNSDALDKIRGLSRNFGRSKGGQMMLEAVERGLNIPDDELPKVSRSKARPPTPPMADLLKVLLKIRCQEAGVASRIVANSGEIEAFAAEPHKDFRFTEGWRHDIFGSDAAEMLAGELALGSNGGQIAVVAVAHEINDQNTGEIITDSV